MKTLEEIINIVEQTSLSLENYSCRFVLNKKSELASLIKKHPVYHKAADALYLDFIVPGTSIRYCGKFYNTVVITHEDPYSQPVNINLKQIFEEYENKENYTQAIKDNDLRNFKQLVNALSFFFQDTILKEEYEIFTKSVNDSEPFDEYEEKIKRLDSDLYFIIRNLFSSIFGPIHIEDTQCVYLPKGLALKIYGKYYNSFLLSRYGIKFAFIKSASSSDAPEEEYFCDHYTSTRNDVINEDYQNRVIHTLDIAFYKGNYHEIIQALKVISIIIKNNEYYTNVFKINKHPIV